MTTQSILMDFSDKDRAFIVDTLDRLIEIAPSRGRVITEIRMTFTVRRLLGISKTAGALMYGDVPIRIRRWPHVMTVEAMLSTYQ